MRAPRRGAPRFSMLGRRLDLDHARTLAAAGDREQDRAGRAAAARRAVPGVAVPRDQGDVRERLDVLDESGDGGYATLAGVWRRGRGRRHPSLDWMHGRAPIARDITIAGPAHAHAAPL